VSHPERLPSLKVPELGPSLGKLIAGSGRETTVSLDQVRHDLATTMMERAGEARRLAANEERSTAIFALSPVFWLTAWEETVNRVTFLVLTEIRDKITREARVAGIPKKMQATFFPPATEGRALTARLRSAGAGLVPALDELERRGADALAATSAGPEALERWYEALRIAARRLEAAWLGLEDRVTPELERWQPVVARVGRWKRPVLPELMLGGILLALALWLGLAFGGFVPAPHFLERLLIR
jgi:hypothetical protein